MSVVLADECLEEHLRSHRMGCQFVGFDHLFHTSIATNDIVEAQKVCWLASQQEPCDSTKGSEVEFTEIRSKKMSDKSLFVEEDEKMSEPSLGGSIDDADDYVDGVGSDCEEINATAPRKTRSGTDSPISSSAPLIRSHSDYERLRLNSDKAH